MIFEKTVKPAKILQLPNKLILLIKDEALDAQTYEHTQLSSSRLFKSLAFVYTLYYNEANEIY